MLQSNRRSCIPNFSVMKHLRKKKVKMKTNSQKILSKKTLKMMMILVSVMNHLRKENVKMKTTAQKILRKKTLKMMKETGKMKTIVQKILRKKTLKMMMILMMIMKLLSMPMP